MRHTSRLIVHDWELVYFSALAVIAACIVVHLLVRRKQHDAAIIVLTVVGAFLLIEAFAYSGLWKYMPKFVL